MTDAPESMSLKTDGASAWGRVLLLTAVLILAWVLWSGLFKPLLLVLGAASCALTVYIARRMGYFSADVFALRYNLRLIGYWVWLGREIIKSSIEVSRIVLSRSPRIDAKVVEVDAKDLELVDQALLGNSITLTPGTLTLDVTDGRLFVHVLTNAESQSETFREMKRRVSELRRG
jgi:multicomponent Na+:H+ antiporter subunit E